MIWSMEKSDGDRLTSLLFRSRVLSKNKRTSSLFGSRLYANKYANTAAVIRATRLVIDMAVLLATPTQANVGVIVVSTSNASTVALSTRLSYVEGWLK